MRNLNQTGAVSLLSTMIFATIVTVLITAYMMTALSQQRQAITHDFSTRAYYTAESGVQDAIRALNAGEDADSDNCAPIGGGNGTIGVPGINTIYTCQLVSEGVDGALGIVAPLETNKTTMIRLNPEDRSIARPYRIVIRWSALSPDQELYARPNANMVFSRASDWYSDNARRNPTHSLLRVGVINHPQTNLNRNNIAQRVVFLNPTNGESGGVSTDNNAGGWLTFSDADSLSVEQENLVNNADCYHYHAAIPETHTVGSTTYSCRRTIVLDTNGYDFTNQEIYVRVSPLYRGTQMYLELQDNNGDPVSLIGGQVTIDVTAKAGNNVFRRVKQVVNVGGDVDVQDGPDAAVIVAEGICKNFAAGLSASDYSEGCNPLTD